MDASIIVAAYVPLDRNKPNYEKLRTEQIEAKEALKALQKQSENLFYTEDTLEEVGRVAQKDRFGLSQEKAKQLVKEVKTSGDIKSLEDEISRKIEKEAEQKSERVAVAEKKTEAEKQTLKEELKKELKQELEARATHAQKRAEETIKKAVLEAKHEGIAAKKIRENIERAVTDVEHVAKVKSYNEVFRENLSVLTINDKHFNLHDGLTVRRPKDIIEGTRPEVIRKVTEKENHYTNREEYKNTTLYIVELASGKEAELVVLGNHKKRDNAVAKDIASRPDVLPKLESWKQGDDPVKYKTPERIEPKRGGNGGGGGGSATNQDQKKITAQAKIETPPEANNEQLNQLRRFRIDVGGGEKRTVQVPDLAPGEKLQGKISQEHTELLRSRPAHEITTLTKAQMKESVERELPQSRPQTKEFSKPPEPEEPLIQKKSSPSIERDR
jgi:hypothetical protein